MSLLQPRSLNAISRTLSRFSLQSLCLTGAFLILGASGCSRKQPPPPPEPATPFDHVDRSQLPAQNFLHKTISVKKYTEVRFEVPAHAATPHLHGTFRAFVRDTGPAQSDDTPNVDFLLLNADQFDDFLHGHGEGTAVYSISATNSHQVDFVLPPTHEVPETYYLVFRSVAGGPDVRSVEANFTLSFGY